MQEYQPTAPGPFFRDRQTRQPTPVLALPAAGAGLALRAFASRARLGGCRLLPLEEPQRCVQGRRQGCLIADEILPAENLSLAVTFECYQQLHGRERDDVGLTAEGDLAFECFLELGRHVRLPEGSIARRFRSRCAGHFTVASHVPSGAFFDAGSASGEHRNIDVGANLET